MTGDQMRARPTDRVSPVPDAESANRVSGPVLGALCVLWLATGTNFLGFKVAVGEIAPFTLTALRLGAAAFVLAPFVVFMSKGLPRLTRTQISGLVVTGCLFLVVGQGLTVVGIQGMPSGYAALLTATVPLFTVLIEWIWRGNTPGRATFFGLALGASGLSIVMVPSMAGPVALGSFLAVLFGAFGWAFGTVWAQTLELPRSALVTTCAQMLIAAVILGCIAVLLEPAFQPENVSGDGWLALGWIVVVGSIVGYGAFVFARPRAPTALANSFFYTGPVVALLLGALVLDEPLGIREVLGAALAIAGVVLILRDRSRPPCPPAC